MIKKGSHFSMIKIRKYQENDLEAIQQISFMIWLELQWNKDIHAQDAVVAEDITTNSVVGVSALAYDATWYYIDKKVSHIPLYQMRVEYAVQDSLPNIKCVEHQLIQAMKEQFAAYKLTYPDKTLALRSWCEESNHTNIQLLLEEGFSAYGTTLVLSFDLAKEIQTYTIPKSIEIGPHSFDGDGMSRYMQANELGFDHVQDSEAELWFRLSGDTIKVFTARDNDKIVASTTVWEIGDGRSAIENIFTIPDYRHQGIARAIIATGLQHLKTQGQKEATLTVLGTNLPAIKLYLSMGFQLKYNLYEMHYTL